VVIVRTKARRYETAPSEGNLKRNGGGTKMQGDNLGRSVLFHLASGIMFCMAATVSTASLALDDEQGRSVLITIVELLLISTSYGYGPYASAGLIAAK
jgi:hypothetical protein